VGAPYPSIETLELFPPGFKFLHAQNLVEDGVPFPERSDGMVICGGPVGSPFYVDAFVRWKTNAAIRKLTAISALGVCDTIPTPKHSAYKLLVTSGTQLLSYVASVVPPQFTEKYFRKFDKAVKAVFFKLIYPGVTPMTDRHERAFHRATLPVGKGGLGLLRTSLSAASVWWSMTRHLLVDVTLEPFLAGLSGYVPNAAVSISDSVGGQDSKAWKDLAPLLLIERVGGVAVPPVNGMLRNFLLAIRDFQVLRVNESFSPVRVEDSSSLTKSDVISFNERSDLNLVFNSRRVKNLSNDHFVKMTTVFLGLPPSQNRANAQSVPGFDYDVETCLSGHGINSSPFLDANADHHSGACPSAALAVNIRHGNLTAAIGRFAQEAGAVIAREPQPYNLCQGLLSYEQCKRIFPKRVTPEYKKVSVEIMGLLTQPSVDQKKLDDLCATLPVLDPFDSKSLRVDLSIRNPETGKVILVDGAFIHTSCAAYREAEFKSVKTRVLSTDQAIVRYSTDPLYWVQSPAITAKAKSKDDKYTPLVQILQHFERQSAFDTALSHSFVPFIVSSRGELSRNAFCLVEEIVAMYKYKVTKCAALAFPLPINRAVSDFRSRFKLALMHVAAAGMANIACSAGKYFGNRAIRAVF
jgi:hypothetical protein